MRLAHVPNGTARRFFWIIELSLPRQQRAQVLRARSASCCRFNMSLPLAQHNRQLNPDLDSLFMTPSEKNTFISSTLVKEVARHGGDVSRFVAPVVLAALSAKLA
ncbi:MAG: hypothetical protein U5L01_04015 [Rheinheimera sp.]|nr:hypothetical protein [Rheinheimera sp.]